MSQVDAEQYYSELEEQLTDEFNAELNRVQLKRLDLIFVTFQDARTVKRWVLNDQSSNSECSSAYGGRVDATFLPSSSLREKGMKPPSSCCVLSWQLSPPFWELPHCCSQHSCTISPAGGPRLLSGNYPHFICPYFRTGESAKPMIFCQE